MNQPPTTLKAALAPLGIAAGIALCGCGSDGSPLDEPLGELSLAAVCADGDMTPGIDVSHWQSTINWTQVAADGVGYAIARTNHGSTMDSQWDANWPGIKAVGMLRGAYQYFDPGGDPEWQATVFIDKVGTLEPGDLPGVIDVEAHDGLTPAQIAANVQIWVDLVEGATGRRPLIYTGPYFWNTFVDADEFADYPLWIAHYTQNCPDVPNTWDDWVMWQYSSTGSVDGIGGNVDLDHFNGSLEQLHDFAANGYRAEIVSLDYPSQMAAGATATAVLEVRNVGARTWTEDTRLGTTEPRDRTSPFASPSWPSGTRAATVEGSVATGETFKLSFELLAPTEAGDYEEHFNLVQEGVAWFSDIVPGGGPLDHEVLLEIAVTAGGGGSGGTGAGGGGGSGAATITSLVPVPWGIPNSNDDGCSLTRTPGRTGDTPGWALLLALALAPLSRRRRRTK